jgi:hypothetical protein
MSFIMQVNLVDLSGVKIFPKWLYLLYLLPIDYQAYYSPNFRDVVVTPHEFHRFLQQILSTLYELVQQNGPAHSYFFIQIKQSSLFYVGLQHLHLVRTDKSGKRRLQKNE